MCLAVFDWQPDSTTPFTLVANRDEFRERPTEAMHWWDQPKILAGKDLLAGGTWLGFDTHGRFALLTNIRPGYVGVKGERSRGDLIVEYLNQSMSITDYAANLKQRISQYGGFNLLLGDSKNLFWLSSTHPEGQWLTPGVHALSNDALNTPWPKVELAKQQMRDYGQQLFVDDLAPKILANQSLADDAKLPSTGVPYEWEKQLSAQTITGENYGTRARTLARLTAEKGWDISEAQIDEQGKPVSQVRFSIDTN